MKREFSTGSNRNSDEGKLDYEGFLSPIVVQKFGEYMHKHRKLEDGTLRDSDNWQKLFGDDHYSVCMKSMWRHFHDLWMEHRGYRSREGIEDAMMGIMFNVNAYAFKYYKEKYEQSNKKQRTQV
jgi:hypothetical protein